MIKMIIVEFKKFLETKFIILYTFITFITCFFITFIEKTLFENTADAFSYLEFLNFNSTFMLVKIIFPVLMIFIVSNVFSSDYSDGTLKYFLLSDISKNKIYFGKIIFIMSISILTILVIFWGLNISFVVFFKDVIIIEHCLIALSAYFLIGIGVIPIVLITIIISFFISDFIKTNFISIGFLILSLVTDGLFEGKFYSPTGFISNANLYFEKFIDISSYCIMIAFYTLLLNIVILMIFNKKDFWL